MMYKNVNSIIQQMSETEAKKTLQKIYSKAKNIGCGYYTPDLFSREVLELYDKQYVTQLFKTAEFNRFPHKFLK